MNKPEFSANFKKDYIAYSAIVIFFMIISFELFIAVFIPAHLEIEGVHGQEVARQEMIGRFDVIRRRFLRFRSKREYATDEAKIIANSLTPLADYLREYQYQIQLKDIEEIDSAISGLYEFYVHLEKQGAYSSNLKLNNGKFIKILEKEITGTH
ncbi:MAG: hypothetical protein WC082_05030 [Victivallales bacterium]